MDGSTNRHGSRAVVVMHTPKGGRVKQSVKFNLSTINNEAKYEAILTWLKEAETLGLREFDITANFKVVLGHIMGESMTHELNMKKYLEAI